MFKRLIDIVLAALGLLVLALPMVVVAIAIRLDTAGPALFRQERVGRHGRHFRILKFRTMRLQSARSERPLTVGDDARITPMGRLLRSRRVDEWPQLFNVLWGDMSLVGPRPEVPRYVRHYPPALKRQVLSVRPGITDPAALAFRNEAIALAQADDPERHYVEVILPAKLALQAEYVRRASVWRDVGVVWESVRVVLLHSNKGSSALDRAA